MTDDAERAWLATAVGEQVTSYARARWGFTNQTFLVALADGTRRAVQRPTRTPSESAMLLQRALAERLTDAGIATPPLLTWDLGADPPWIVRGYLPGTTANTLLEDEDAALAMAALCGALLPQIAATPTHGLALDVRWAAGETLAAAAAGWLATIAAPLGSRAALTLADVCAELPQLFAGRPPRLAHGDFCPVNLLIDGGRISGVLDLEGARLADALFDVAWWGWVVRFHHPERWRAIWPTFMAAATQGDVSDEAGATRERRIWALQLLQLLERAALEPAQRELWVERLLATLSRPD